MKEKINKFIEGCISSGKCVSTNIDLSHENTLEIEDILNRYSDSTARTKIRKILKNIK